VSVIIPNINLYILYVLQYPEQLQNQLIDFDVEINGNIHSIPTYNCPTEDDLLKLKNQLQK